MRILVDPKINQAKRSFAVMKKWMLTIVMIATIASTGWADLNLANRWNFRPQCDQAQDCDRSACIDPSCDGCDTQTCCDGCGRYLSLFGGWSHVLSYRGADSVVERQGDFSDGFLLGTAFGKQIGCHLRAEAEFAYRFNQADQWSSTPFNNQRVPQQWDGDLNVFSGMTNLVYDFGNRNCNKITPYVGGGIGVAILDGDFSTNATQFEIDDTVFAYQGFAGALFHTGRCSALFAEYRFFGTTQTELVGNSIPLGQFEYLSHNVIGGIQFRR